MKKFESVIILRPTLKKTEIKEIVKKADDAIERVADIIEKEELGLKKLAYEIKGEKEGYYVSHKFDMKKEIDNYADSVGSIEIYFKTQEEIIKFIVVKRD